MTVSTGEGVDIDVKNFQNIMAMALLMGLVGVALSVSSAGERTAAVAAKGAKGPVKSKVLKNGTSMTPAKHKKT